VWTARRRRAPALGIALAVILPASPSHVFALNPALDASEYAHTSWRIRDGFSKGTIFSVAQTPDGYLWLGTDLGMLRFDGLRPLPWQPPSGQSLPSSNIRSLLVTRDGALWIGTEGGVARWKDGKLTRYDRLTGRFVGRLVEDHEGSIWATTYFDLKWTLCVIQHGDGECYGDDGGPGVGALGVYEDRSGRLWAGTVGPTNGLWRWRPGPPKFFSLSQQANGIRGLYEDADGVLLLSRPGGITRFVDGSMEMAYPFPTSKKQFDFSHQLRDRDGGLWLGSSTGGGLVHIHQDRTDTFASSDGLSGDQVSALFEDREGNIWVATTEGLDRFREIPVASFSAQQGLSTAQADSVLAARDGSIWIGTADRVNRLSHGRTSSYPEPSGSVTSIFQDSLGRIWLSTAREVGYVEDGRFVAVKNLGGGLIRSIVEDSEANLWIANQDRGLFRVSTGSARVDFMAWAALNLQEPASALAADGSQRGVWLGLPQGGVLHFADGRVRASYGVADGLGAGRVSPAGVLPDRLVCGALGGHADRARLGRPSRPPAHRRKAPARAHGTQRTHDEGAGAGAHPDCRRAARRSHAEHVGGHHDVGDGEARDHGRFEREGHDRQGTAETDPGGHGHPSALS
jgi:ligand-binding sensor domain-containing protein